jgi:hypothetical protein
MFEETSAAAIADAEPAIADVFTGYRGCRRRPVKHQKPRNDGALQATVIFFEETGATRPHEPYNRLSRMFDRLSRMPETVIHRQPANADANTGYRG